MQTFLPHPSFAESAKSLDNRRLNKQITECKQIALAILDPSYGWQHHPAVRMWRGSFASLIRYGIALGAEWHRRFLTGERGGKESHKAAEWLTERYLGINWVSPYSYRMPSWLGSPKFHASHRAALLFKDPEWYGQFGWAEPPAVPDEKGRLPCVWPEELEVQK